MKMPFIAGTSFHLEHPFTVCHPDCGISEVLYFMNHCYPVRTGTGDES